MEIGTVVTRTTIAEAWLAGLGCFQDPSRLWRHESDRGVTFDLPCLTLIATEPADTQIPTRYPYPKLVEQYMSWLYGDSRDVSLLHRRLFSWDRADEEPFDQTLAITEILSRQPGTRSAVFSLWRPDADLGSPFPPSPVAGSFRVLDGSLHLFVVGRSADYWLGAIPDMVTMARLQSDIADSVGYPIGPLVFHMWSAHIYEDEYLANVFVRR
jgi:hypothetical protein